MSQIARSPPDWRAANVDHPDELSGHALLHYCDGVGRWTLLGPDGRGATIAAAPRLRAGNGDTLHDWCLAGHGIMLKSIVDLRDDLACGRLEQVLPYWSDAAAPVVALYAGRRNQSRKVRVFLDAMAVAMREPTLV